MDLKYDYSVLKPCDYINKLKQLSFLTFKTLFGCKKVKSMVYLYSISDFGLNIRFDKSENSVYTFIQTKRCLSILKMSINPKNGFTTLERAILIADYRIFTFLVKNGADLNQKITMKDRKGTSILEFAKQLKSNAKKRKRKELDKIFQYMEQQNIKMYLTSMPVPRES